MKTLSSADLLCPEPSFEENEGGPVKPFLEHLEDLRWVLIRCLVTVSLGAMGFGTLLFVIGVASSCFLPVPVALDASMQFSNWLGMSDSPWFIINLLIASIVTPPDVLEMVQGSLYALSPAHLDYAQSPHHLRSLSIWVRTRSALIASARLALLGACQIHGPESGTPTRATR